MKDKYWFPRRQEMALVSLRLAFTGRADGSHKRAYVLLLSAGWHESHEIAIFNTMREWDHAKAKVARCLKQILQPHGPIGAVPEVNLAGFAAKLRSEVTHAT